MNRDDLIDTIRRLLALGRSPNEHEAQAAIAKAQELLLKHGLDLKEIEASSRDDWHERPIWQGSRIPSEVAFVADIVQTFFFVQIAFGRRRRGEAGPARVYLFGRPHHVAIAEHVFAFLRESFRDLWREYSERHRADGKSARPFFAGLRDGFAERLRYERRCQVQNFGDRRALTEYKGAIEREWQRRNPQAKTARRAPLAWRPAVYLAGVEQGREIRLRQAIAKAQESPALSQTQRSLFDG